MGARPRFFRNLLVLLGCFTLSWQLGRTQNSGAVPARIGEVKTSGSLRTRVESWNWFEGSANNDYPYAGSILRFSVKQSRSALAWEVEFALPVLLGLPDERVFAATLVDRHAELAEHEGVELLQGLPGQVGFPLLLHRAGEI